MPCPGAGTKRSTSSMPPASASRPRRAQPSAREHDRVEALARLGELAQPRVDVAADRHHVEILAGGAQLRLRRMLLVPTRAPAGSSSSPRAPQRTSSAGARAGAPRSTSPSASSPGTSLAECTARSICPASSASSSTAIQRDLSLVRRRVAAGALAGRRRWSWARSRSPRARQPPELGDQPACANASSLRRVPMRIRATRGAAQVRGPSISPAPAEIVHLCELRRARRLRARPLRPRAGRTARARARGSHGHGLR